MNWGKWWNTPPNKNDIFFTRIRRLYQYLNKCDHVWTHDKLIVHGEEHGYNMNKRRCRNCNQKQRLKYHLYGKIRYEWVDEIDLWNYSWYE